MNTAYLKNLFHSDPLMFAFILIIEEAFKGSVHIFGKDETIDTAPDNSFQFAVPSQSLRPKQNPNNLQKKFPVMESALRVQVAIWSSKPDWKDCQEYYTNCEGRKIDITHLHNFRQWQTDKIKILSQIILSLESSVFKKCFCFKIENKDIQYVYAKDKTANNKYGIVATFVLLAKPDLCCPKNIDADILTEASILDKFGIDVNDK